MEFNINTVLWLFLVFLGTWLGVLTFLLFRTLSNYNRLTRGVSNKTLSELLSSSLKEEQQTQEKLRNTLLRLDQINTDARGYVQKIGVVRFNPFADTGGDQSFSLALLDGDDNGIILTSFYARTGVRWYIKTIRGARGVEHELSNKEKEALKKALHLK